MPSFTKKAIIDAFMHQASKKPLEKITVRDVVDDCGINRNTFYYHFQDIFAVLEEICLSGTAKMKTTLPLGDMLSDLFLVLIGYAARYPKAMAHIAASIGQSGAERYFAKGFDSTVFAVLERETGSADVSELRTATVFLRHAFIGLFVDWINAGGKIDGEKLAARIALMSQGVCDAVSKIKHFT
ncbi:MAG: TetR/AcrR family transcriptional regulator C-terminal domain-containing protein [Clostridia bacterium]|nr:TetR/AcrR family transcriptional regulator C-terminal domain-containing protein [Clostridia bacterium]